MPRPKIKIPIPYHPIKGISEQLEEGRSYQEIADSFGVSKNTIARRIYENKESE